MHDRQAANMRRQNEISFRNNHTIACTLHDGIAQDLAGAAMLLRAAASRVSDVSVTEAIEVVNGAIKDIQAIAEDLSPSVAAHDELVSALTLLVEDLRRSHVGIEIVFKSQTARETLRRIFSVENHLYHIAREALYNAIKHSQSDRVTLAFEIGRAEICLTVQDYGCGVSSATVVSSTRGLRLMAQRASQIGGTLSVVGSSKLGTCVTCSVPMSLLQLQE